MRHFILVLSSEYRVLVRLLVFLRCHLEMGTKRNRSPFFVILANSSPPSTLKRSRRGKWKIYDG